MLIVYGALVGALVTVSSLLAVFFLWRRMGVRRREADLKRARDVFHQRREWLEARFVTLASQSGKPRGLTWAECDFQDEVRFARDRVTGQLRALVGLTIRFKAVEGGGMEDNPNVGNLRAATAVFRLDNATWETDGRAIFNLNPAETIQHFHHELDKVD